MNATTIIKRTLKVDSKDMKQRFYSSRLELLGDYLSDNPEDFEQQIKHLHADIVTLKDEGFRSLFQDGYTMVLLTGEEFDFVDSFMDKPGKGTEEELTIAVTRNGEVVEEIPYTDLSY